MKGVMNAKPGYEGRITGQSALNLRAVTLLSGML